VLKKRASWNVASTTASPPRLGGDGVEHPRRRARRAALLDQRHVELDDVGREERHQRERALVDADVVERDAAAALAQPADRGEHFGVPTVEAGSETGRRAARPGANLCRSTPSPHSAVCKKSCNSRDFDW